MDKLLTVQEAAEFANCHPQSIYRNQEIPKVKLPGIGVRIKKSFLEKYIDKHSYGPPFSGQQSFDYFALTIPSGNGKKAPNSLGGYSEMPKGKSKTRYNLGYGAVYQRKTKKGKTRWYLDYRDRDGKRVQKLAPLATTKEEAILALREEITKAFSNEYGIKKQKEEVRFKEFSDMYLESYAKSNKRSWKDDAYRLQKFNSYFGKKFLHEVTAFDIEKFKTIKIKEDLEKSTINRYLTILKRMFNIAIDWGYSKDNPVNRVKFYSEKDNIKERILTYEEEVRLLEAASAHLKPILIVALNTGMRRGEILNLKWNQIDFETREIRIEKTKSGKPRIVDINSTLLKELLNLKNERKSNCYLFLNPKTGKPFKKLQTSFKGACERAGIKDLRMHDLRHTFASRLVEKGVDLIRVKEILGHSTVKITERYTHSNRDERKRAVELLSREPLARTKKQENLLHICDTKKKKDKYNYASSLFSVN